MQQICARGNIEGKLLKCILSVSAIYLKYPYSKTMSTHESNVHVSNVAIVNVTVLVLGYADPGSILYVLGSMCKI